MGKNKKKSRKSSSEAEKKGSTSSTTIGSSEIKDSSFESTKSEDKLETLPKSDVEEPIDNRRRFGKSEQFKRFKDNDEGAVHKKRYSLNERQTRDNSAGRRSYFRMGEDKEFLEYESEFRSHSGCIEYKKVNEIKENLFKMPEEYSLAHCVAEDMNMGRGIAVEFRWKFRRVDELLNQEQKTGGLAILKLNNRFIYYMVTKRYSSGKPTYASLFASLKKLRNHMDENNIQKLAIPTIGCGLDRLEWEQVKFMIEFIFRNSDVEIVVCIFEPTEDFPQQRHRNCRVTHERYPIETIAESTVILYFSSEDEAVSEEMLKLDEKFNFLREFKNARKTVGDVIFYNRNPQYLLCGCITKKRKTNSFDYSALTKCLHTIQKENKKHQFFYYAFQAFKDSDFQINYKIINIMRNALRDAEVYVCWPGDLEDLMCANDRFTTKEKSLSRENSFSKNEKSWRSTGDSFASNVQKDEKNWDDQYKAPDQFSNFNTSSISKKQQEGDKYDWFQNLSNPQKELFNDFDEGEIDHFWPDTHTEFPFTSQSCLIGEIQQNFQNYEHRYESNSESDASESSNSLYGFSWSNQDEKDKPSTSQPKNTSKPKQNQRNFKTEDIKQEVNSEFESFEREFKSGNIADLKEQNKVNLPKVYSLVCFASEDLIIHNGVPEDFELSKYIGKLLNQNKKVGDLASACTKEESNIFCLIVNKPKELPTPLLVFTAIQKLRNQLSKNNVKKLVIPIMENWTGGPEWTQVKSMFQFLLKRHQIELVLAPFEKKHSEEKNLVEIMHQPKEVQTTKRKSALIYLASADNESNDMIKCLSKKFDFYDEFKNKKKKVGDVIKFKPNEDYALYGCIVNKKHQDEINFEALQSCLLKVVEQNKTENHTLVAIQAMKEEIINYKLITVLLHSIQKLKIVMCWPGELKNIMPSKCK